MVEERSPEAVNERLDEADVQVIDIRPEEAFRAGHVPGAMNVPMSELPARIEELDLADEVVVACPIGQSSVQAARLIDSFEAVDDDDTVASMAGGYEAWEYELERGEDEAGTGDDGDD
ncbi:MAG: rhodanese-like domain-containing protein [Halolamina sp.]